MKIYPGKQFYYQEAVESLNYSETPSGQAAPERLFHGKSDWWVHPRPSVMNKPKTLILIQWGLKLHWPAFDMMEMLLNWKPLPFKIYALQAEQLVPLSQELLRQTSLSHDLTRNIKPIMKEKMDQLLVKHQLDPQKCLYLDHHQFNQLLHQETVNASINFHYLCGNDLIESQEEALRCFQSFHKTFEIIYSRHNSFYYELFLAQKDKLKRYGKIRIKLTSINVNEIHEVQQQFPGNHPDLKSIRIDKNNNSNKKNILQIENILSEQYPRLESLCFANIVHIKKPTRKISSKTLKSVRLDKLPSQSLNTILSVLKNCPNLHSLQLRYDSKIALKINSKIRLPSIQKLEIHLSNNAANFLANIGHIFPELRKLDILQFDNEKLNRKQFDISPLPKLQQLGFSGIPLEFNALLSLLKTSPNLNKLEINPLSFPVNQKILPETKLPRLLSLMEIEIHHSTIPATFLNQILKIAPNLNKLQLSHCTLSDGRLSSKPMAQHCPNLVNITFYECSLTNHSLKSILTSTPNLKSLAIHSCKYKPAHEPFQLKNNALPRLERLTHKGNDDNIPSMEVHHILTASPRLKNFHFIFPKLKLQLPYILKHSGKAWKNGLEKLTLDYDNCKKKVDILQSVLDTFPNLNTLHLIKWNSRELFIENKQYPNIKNLTIESSDIYGATFKSLIATLPQLIKLDFCSKVSIIGNFDLTGIQLPQLQYLFGTAGNKNWEKISKHFSGNKNIIQMKSTLYSLAGMASSSYSHSVTTVDANTRFQPKLRPPLNRQIYALEGKHPSPAEYRKQCFDHLEISTKPIKINKAFKLSSQQPVDLIRQKVKVSKGNILDEASSLEHAFLGRTHLHQKDQWQTLPGLKPDDYIHQIKLSPQCPFELAFDKVHCQYLIRFPSFGKKLFVEYLFTSPPSNPTSSIPQSILEKIKSIRAFGKKPLSIKERAPSGQDYLDAIERQKTGACRHRAILFKAWMDKFYSNLLCQIVNNDCHSFCEIFIHGSWQRIDLGGYPAELDIHDSFQSKLQLKENKLSVIPKVSTEQYLALFSQFTNNNKPIRLETVPEIFKTDKRKILVKSRGKDAAQEALTAIYRYALDNGYAVFWAGSADDLYCSSSWLKKKNQIGVIKPGPGGTLHRFLTAPENQLKPLLLLIHYTHFNANEIIHFNAVLDDNRKVDGTPLPESCRVIGIQDIDDPDCYQGSDFYSRFNQHHFYQVSEDTKALFDKSAASSQVCKDQSINLYRSAQWKQMLLGKWLLRGQQFHFVEGQLPQLLKKNIPVTINNAPLQNSKYQLFWKKALIDKNIEGIPFDWNLIHHQSGYDWPVLVDGHYFSEIRADEFFYNKAELLNLYTFPQFFPHSVCDNKTKEFKPVKGIIEKKKGQSLKLLVTEALNVDQWARLLEHANTSQVKLEVQCLAGIDLPDVLHLSHSSIAASSSGSQNSFSERTGLHHSSFIYSEDIDVSIALLQQKHPHALAISVSDMKVSDLLHQLKKLNKDALDFHFTNQQLSFSKSLTYTRQRFILYGNFDRELFQALLPLIQRYRRRLFLVTEQAELFEAFDPTIHQVTIDEKLACLQQEERKRLCNFTSETLESLSLCKLRALSRFQKLHLENQDVNAPWQAFYQLKQECSFSGKIIFKNSARISKAFFEHRFKQIEQQLKDSPFVFISGMTGVGKSSFILKTWMRKYPGEVYLGEEQITAWIKNKKGGYLFIDEANVSRRNWTEFEGLLAEKPFVFIDGKWQSVSARHKVIFAGNPLNYGGSRHQAELFERHANAIVFNPFPPDVIFDQILKPIFKQSRLHHDCHALSATLLKAYQLLLNLSSKTLLITPRQLKSCAMLTLAEWEENQTENPRNILEKYIRLILKAPLDETQQKLIEEHFPLQPMSVLSFTAPQQFYISSSRKPAASLITALLRLRTFKQTKKLNPEQLYGDLNSLVLESMPGQGKTELLKAMLKAKGFEEGDLFADATQENIYYQLPVTMALNKKEQILRKAFREGHVVIIDEINSSPMLERLLNALLAGHTPEGQCADKPGFLILGTQNPAFMGARLSQTPAQLMRMIKLALPDYSEKEMKDILVYKNLSPQKTEALLMAYAIHQQKALNQSSEPLNFRQVLDIAQRLSSNASVENNQQVSRQGMFAPRQASTVQNDGGLCKSMVVSGYLIILLWAVVLMSLVRPAEAEHDLLPSPS